MNILKLKKFEPIYIIGHSKPDVDSIVSAKILCDILNHFNIESYYAILDREYEIKGYNMKILQDCMSYNPRIVNSNEISKYNWFLVDHNDVGQSIKTKENVIGCFDHHININEIDNAEFSNICCNALFIYETFKKNYNFDDIQKKQIFYAFITDASFGRSSRYKESDKQIAQKLGFDMNLNSYFKKYFTPTVIFDEKMDILNSVLENEKKQHNFENIYFESCFVEELGTNGLEKYKSIINDQASYLGIWHDYEKNETYAFLKYRSKLKEFKYNHIASRATEVIVDTLKYIKNEYNMEK